MREDAWHPEHDRLFRLPSLEDQLTS